MRAVGPAGKGTALEALGRREEELATYEDSVARFSENAPPAAFAQVARILFVRAIPLAKVR